MSEQPEINMSTSNGGSNPNKNNAKNSKNRPKFNKPKNKNGIKGQTYFAEPVIDFKEDNVFDHAPMREKKIAGTFLIDYDLPYHLSKPYLTAMVAKMRRNSARDDNIKQNVTHLEATTYFACVKQLYSTLDDRLLVNNIDFKPVASTNYDLPKFLSGQIGLIGNFQSLLGPMELEYITQLLKGWTKIGCKLLSYEMSNFEIPYFKFPVSKDDEGIAMIKELLADEITTQQTTSTVQVNEHELTIRPPIANADNLSIESSFDPSYNFRDDYRDAGMQKLTHVIEWETTATEAEISIHGINFALTTRFTSNELKMEFSKAINHERMMNVSTNTVFNLITSPSGKSGSPGQLVRADDIIGYSPVLLSDEDGALGFICNPYVRHTINQSFRSQYLNDSEGLRTKFVNQSFREPGLIIVNTYQ